MSSSHLDPTLIQISADCLRCDDLRGMRASPSFRSYGYPAGGKG
jgi:hypothetical protein